MSVVLGKVLGSPVQDRHGHTEVSQAKATKVMNGLRTLSYKQMLRELALTDKPVEEKTQKYLSSMRKYLLGGCKEDGARLFSTEPRDRTGGNRHNLQYW